MSFFIKSGNEGSSLKTVLIFRIVLAVFTIGITLTLFSLGVTLWQTRALIQSVLKTNADSIKEKIEFMMHGVEVDAKMYASLFQKLFNAGGDQKKDLLLFVMENLKSNKEYDGFAYFDAKTGVMFRLIKDKDQNLLVVEVKPKGNGIFTTTVYKDYLMTNQAEIDNDPNQIDPRTFSFFSEMKENNKARWVHSRKAKSIKYLEKSSPFLSYALPLNDSQGELMGLISLDVGVIQLEELLGEITNQKSNFSELYEGVPFVIEKRNDDELLVIGYPHKHDEEEFPRSIGKNDYSGYLFLADQHPDLRIQTFTKLVQSEKNAGNDIFNQEVTSIESATDINGKIWVYSWSEIKPGEKPDWVVGVCVSRKAVSADSIFTGRLVFLSLIGMIIIMIPIGIKNGKSIGEPLEKMAADVVKIGRGDISFSDNPKSRYTEIIQLTDGIEKMKSGLLSFRKYIPYKVVNQVLASRKTAEPFAEKKELTLFFSDLENFTTISESLEPDKLVKLIGDHLAMCTNIIQSLDGTVDKYIGDSVMAFWNAPEDCENHELKACQAALACQEQMVLFNERNKAEGLPHLKMRIGISTGTVFVGNIGSDDRLNYTAVGDTVNLASRLEGTNKTYKTWILISDKTQVGTRGQILTRPVDKVAVKGKANAILIHEVLGRKENETPELRQIIDLTMLGFEHYLAMRFQQAKDCFTQILDINKEDHLALFYIERCKGFLVFPPPSNWDGTCISHSK
ncbi:MAG: adenylate/guanylate cyclase domain-containing protein [Planctomycetota bacterium]|nr:adenylate/guanylate cyclase domain-containing protein [Planctomycetota bacterium]